MIKLKLRTKYLSQLRKRWVKEKWKKHKGDITMTDLADIFGVSVARMNHILKKGR